MRAKTIFYVLDLYEKIIVETFEGVQTAAIGGGFVDVPPVAADELARDRANKTGHTHAISIGRIFYQQDKP